MNNVARAFFLTAGLFALIGMAWGIQMSATHDQGMAPAHGHLNLIGFVAMSVFGAYYALSPRAAASRLAWPHYGVTVATVIVLAPGIALALSGTTEALAQLGSLLAVLSMLLFVVVVARNPVVSLPGG